MIPYALMAYRATRHSSTGLTPNMMLFGKEITEPIDLVAGLPPDHDNVNTVPEYVMHMRDRLELSHQLAREALGKSNVLKDTITKTFVKSSTKLEMRSGTW